ncbi:TELO2-interacting protein 1 homolog [Venturia canescens]|uniref:TELO2-interacting protein 1 homolog n=1 Tax=Venturia canescens TaxID=32260 RepID=UPI001C9C3936|nr:TELO2-interacting protein 1 homolog [Venturia canescens]XP_043272167.1 TELO2-interacting protein 1 homolog [Venturia canescens]XP_043272168.1 TELO2-interacting protein 1 homolog [Venturia canescens]XP_043272169.1 TELO2-interacting protein 1 homolog [Venturia canescens]
MGAMDIPGVFVALKSQWELVKRKPDVQIARIFSQTIQQHSNAEIQHFLEYILIPVEIHLHNDKISKEVRQHIVELLRSVLSKARILNMNNFIKLYTGLLVQIYDPAAENMLVPSHEELKESTVKCLNDLIKRTSMDIIECLYVRKNAAKLSQGVYTCLSVAKTEKLNSLRLAAIETLMTLFQVHDEVDTNDIVHRAQVASTVMFFLPGIAHGLHQVALGNDLQNHRITMTAIRAFGRIVALIMEDQPGNESLTIESVIKKQNIEKPFDPLGNCLKLEGDKGMKKHLETTIRSQEWLDAASVKLNGLMRSLVNLVRHPYPQVRKELSLAVKLLLTRCSRNMTHNFMELVEILISLSEDNVEDIRNSSRAALNEMNEKFTNNHGMRPIVELLEENFYKLLTKLPRLIRRSDDSIQLAYLNQLAGYIKLLGEQRLPHVMASVSHLRRLLLALVYVAELDCSHVSVLEEIQAKDIEDGTYNTLDLWKSFKFIRDKLTEEKFLFICKLLGELGDLSLLVDSIFDLSSEMPQYRKELTLILNSISTAPISDPSVLIVHEQIIENYTDSENWYLPIEVSEDITLGEAQSNIVNCCFMVEGLGNIASTIKNEYEKYLLKTLYLVIERAGSGNSLISRAGLKSLEKIAHSQNHKSVAELLENNVDYVSFHVTMKMRRVERNPGVLDVFSVVMKYSTADVLPCLQGVVEDALDQLSTNNHGRNVQSLLKALYIFTICVRKLTNYRESVSEEKKEKKLTKAEVVIESLVEYYEAKQAAKNIEEEVVTSPEDIEKEMIDGTAEQFSAYNNQEENEKVKPPPHVKMTEDVMKCCLNFLPSKDIAKSLLAMQILEEGLFILAKWSEQLLPLVHQMWHPLVDRFNDPNVLVINRAWQLLYTLAHVSQDFIRSRTLKQVLPSLATFLTKSAKESYKKDSKNAYKFTQMYKLQRILLSQAGIVAKNLRLQERELWQMLEITQPYLSSYQHPTLQECCVQLYKEVADCNVDVVWVKCLGIWNRHVGRIPKDHNLTTVGLKTLISGQSDYQKNVEAILAWIEETTVDL